jgi:predicted ATP-binding protein involved in virulence
MQKEALPFLTTMFPNIQFIVTTHSPFVITSLENAVICDLEKRIVTQDLSAYSYDGIVEYYYGADKYSTDAKIKFEEYKKLAEIDKRTPIETERLADIIQYFKQIPSLGAPELMLSFLQFEQKRRDKALEAANGKN